jgi:hypothetical protein
MRMRAEHLRPHGWQPGRTLHIPSWCGCATEYVPTRFAPGCCHPALVTPTRLRARDVPTFHWSYQSPQLETQAPAAAGRRRRAKAVSGPNALTDRLAWLAWIAAFVFMLVAPTAYWNGGVLELAPGLCVVCGRPVSGRRPQRVCSRRCRIAR